MKQEFVAKVIEEVVEGIYKAYPMLEEKYGSVGREKCVEDNYHHFKHLDTAYALNETKIFTDYALWLNNILTSRGMKEDHLIDNFERIHLSLQAYDDEEISSYSGYLTSAIATLQKEKQKKGK
ncbi:hypothetical protein [Metabacillus litoralis]|uniref:hypothetical protein n=1 Tax=Metabacillus litoralis TaxID=152268 RepID=UPI001CFCDF2E|nr:hypothetical protein [Metabacillus litoralis]